MRVGSLCTGIAGLELGLRLAGIDVEPVFVSDIDSGACKWLEANMPDTPNLGDFTVLNELPEVDLITAGFPCQPLSTAGLRKGVEDERWIFDDIARLVSRMESRPLLFLENVPGLLTANSGNAMGRVVHQLAAIGYHITWGTLSATAVGAPHRRLRWWGLAWQPENVNQKWSILGSSSEERPPAPAGGTDSYDAPADTVGWGLANQCNAVASEPEQPRIGSDRNAPADTDSPSRETRVHSRLDSQLSRSQPVGHSPHNYGRYAAAVQRWELILGRAAPNPVDEKHRLNPAFVEWMMGYPEGWVTDILTRRAQSLHALGNAVVPQCAAAAWTQLKQRVVAS